MANGLVETGAAFASSSPRTADLYSQRNQSRADQPPVEDTTNGLKSSSEKKVSEEVSLFAQEYGELKNLFDKCNDNEGTKTSHWHGYSQSPGDHIAFRSSQSGVAGNAAAAALSNPDQYQEQAIVGSASSFSPQSPPPAPKLKWRAHRLSPFRSRADHTRNDEPRGALVAGENAPLVP